MNGNGSHTEAARGRGIGRVSPAKGPSLWRSVAAASLA
jgi:hypothetical protein